MPRQLAVLEFGPDVFPRINLSPLFSNRRMPSGKGRSKSSAGRAFLDNSFSDGGNARFYLRSNRLIPAGLYRQADMDLDINTIPEN